jgi:alpha-beta hydrolase superfamily lysophospholipase
VIATLRILARLPLIAAFIVCAPMFWLVSFALGDEPREATKMTRGMVGSVVFGRLP